MTLKSIPSAIPLRRVLWKPCWRIIPSHYPTKNVFERVAAPKDLDAVQRLEQMTGGRPVEGEKTDYVAAAFAYRNPLGSRFSDGTYGVYYAARTLATALHESTYHREKFLKYTHEKPMRLGMRVVIARLDGRLHDLRGLRPKMPEVYSPTGYRASQTLGLSLKKQGSHGVAYDSVRDPKGQCAAVFDPRALSHSRQERHLTYEWNGKRIERIYELREYLRAE